MRLIAAAAPISPLNRLAIAAKGFAAITGWQGRGRDAGASLVARLADTEACILTSA